MKHNDTEINSQLIETMMSIGRIMKQHIILASPLTDLTLLQFEMLSYLKRNEKVQMKDISNNFKITKPTATTLLTKLITLKLIKRSSNADDRRVVYVQLTSLGKDLFENMAKERRKKIHSLLSILNTSEKDSLLKILRSLSNHAQDIYEK